MSTLNLSQEIVQCVETLAPGQWRGFGEILNTVGSKITAEKASQVYTSEVKEHSETVKKLDTEDIVRLGRRRMVAKSLSQLVYYGHLECQDRDKSVHERMYRKGTGKRQLTNSLASTIEDVVLLLNDAQECFEKLTTGHEQADFKRQLRSLKRIVELHIARKDVEALKKENDKLKRGNG